MSTKPKSYSDALSNRNMIISSLPNESFICSPTGASQSCRNLSTTDHDDNIEDTADAEQQQHPPKSSSAGAASPAQDDIEDMLSVRQSVERIKQELMSGTEMRWTPDDGTPRSQPVFYNEWADHYRQGMDELLHKVTVEWASERVESRQQIRRLSSLGQEQRADITNATSLLRSQIAENQELKEKLKQVSHCQEETGRQLWSRELAIQGLHKQLCVSMTMLDKNRVAPSVAPSVASRNPEDILAAVSHKLERFTSACAQERAMTQATRRAAASATSGTNESGSSQLLFSPGSSEVTDSMGSAEMVLRLNCVICMSRPRQMMMQPCNHVCLCYGCDAQLFARPEQRDCPVCRQQVARRCTVFL